MSYIRITPPQQCCILASLSHGHLASSLQLVAPLWKFQPLKTSTVLRAGASIYLCPVLPKISLKLCSSGVRKGVAMCSLSGEGKSQSDDQGSPFKAFEKVIGSSKKDSVEDVLRQQIQNQEYYDGGSGRSGPGSGGGGGSNGSGGPGGSEDESLSGIWDEVVQVILATVGFIFLYLLIIEGEEITTFARDIIKFLFTGRKSIRLRRLADDCSKSFREMMATRDEDPHWLEKEIINTPTWWDSPAKYKILYRRYLASKSEE